MGIMFFLYDEHGALPTLHIRRPQPEKPTYSSGANALYKEDSARGFFPPSYASRRVLC